jgi:hypothetical protein
MHSLRNTGAWSEKYGCSTHDDGKTVEDIKLSDNKKRSRRLAIASFPVRPLRQVGKSLFGNTSMRFLDENKSL